MDTSLLLKKLEEFYKQGIIGRVKKAIEFTDEPKFPQWFCGPSKEHPDILEEQYGSSLALDDNTSKIKSIGEAIERYCSEKVDNKLIVNSTYVDLGATAVDPAIFINYSNNFLKGKRNEYIDKIRSEEISWIYGVYLNSKEQKLIPAQVVYSPYDISKEPVIRTPISTGAAFGVDKDSALDRGLLEVIERDSFMITWLTKRKCPLIDLSNTKLNDIKEYFERYLIEPHVIDITTDIEIPSMMGVLIDRTGIGPAVSIGLKSSLNAYEAAIGALLEAQHVRGWIRFSYQMDNKPVINSPTDIKDLKSRGYYWYPTNKIDKLDFLLRSHDIKDLSNKTRQLNHKPLADYLIEKGLDIYLVDISTEEVKKEGFFVLKSIIPSLHPLCLDEDLPYDYSERLLKYLSGEINKTPHPFL